MMQNFKTFEDLVVYQAARELRKKIYELVRKLPEIEKYNLASQMRRAVLSITNNIAEGHGRYSYQENIQFLRQSRGSLQELIDDLNLCADEQYIELSHLNNLKAECSVLLKKLNGYIKFLKERKLSVSAVKLQIKDSFSVPYLTF